MLKRCLSLFFIAVTIAFLPPVSTAVRARSRDVAVDLTKIALSEPPAVAGGLALSEPPAVAGGLALSEPPAVAGGLALSEPPAVAGGLRSTDQSFENAPVQSDVPASRLARLRHGINLSHWFAQSADYSKAHLETHTTAEDIALIKSIGFDHVRLTLEPAPLFNWEDPSRLKAEYLKYLDTALDLMLAQGLAVIVDIHPSDEFKIRLNSNDRQIEAFGKFWRALAQHLSTRDPERVFLEVINEPMVEDGYRWFGMQGKLIAAIRAGAPQHTIIASGHRWSGIAELLFMLPYADRNIIYNFHFYEPFAFTHQGATWAGPNLPFYKNIPYPSNPESIGKILDTVQDDPARYNLLRYGEDRWNAARMDNEISAAAAWAAKYQVPLTCNEFGTFRNFAPAADRAVWIGDMRTVMEKYGIGWTMWDYAGGFGVVNKVNGHATPDGEVVKALGLAVQK